MRPAMHAVRLWHRLCSLLSQEQVLAIGIILFVALALATSTLVFMNFSGKSYLY